MIRITGSISINESEIQLQFIRASGPGGQNVNKVATAVQLRFSVNEACSLPAEVRARLIALAGKRMTADGVLIIDARRFRTQEQNRRDALARLVSLIRQAAARPKPRYHTRPTRAAQQRRLEAKRRRAGAKRLRRKEKRDWIDH